MPLTNPDIQAISASDSVFSSGTVRITGGPNVTVGTDASGLSISGAGGGGGGGSFTLSGSNLSVSDSAVLTGSNAVTVKTSAGQRFVIDAPTQTVQSQNLHNVTLSGNTSGALAAISSGTLTLAGGNNVTLSQAGNAVTISGPNVAGAQTGISGISASDTLYTSGTVKITGSNMVTVKSGAAQAVVVDATQSAQTQSNIQSIAASNTTYQTGQVEFTGSNAATVKSSAGQRVVIDVPVQTAQTQSNVQGVAGSNTTYNTGTVELTGSNMVTVRSSAGQRLVIDASQSSETGSMLPSGNTAGTTANLPLYQNIQLAGGPGITISQSSGASSTRITISGGAVAPGPSVVPVSNTTGTTASLTSGTFGLGGGQNITISQSSGANSTNLVVVGPATTVQTNAGVPVFRNVDQADVVALSHFSLISKTPYYFGVSVPGNLTLNTVGFRLSHVTTGTAMAYSLHLGVYSQVNSTSAALLASASNSFALSTASSASWSGVRDVVMQAQSNVAGMSTLSQGRYIFGVMVSAVSTASANFSLMGQVGSTAGLPLGVIGPGANAASTATSQGINALVGPGSTTVNAMPANVVASEIRNQGQATGSVPLIPAILIRS